MTVADVGLKIIELASSVGGVWAITQIIKVHPGFPWVQEGQVAKIRAIAAVLSAVAVALWQFSDKSLTPDTLQGVLVAIGSLVAVWGGAHVTSQLAPTV